MFQDHLHKIPYTLPDSAYTVTADGVALPAASGGNPALLALSFQTVRIRQGQTVVITYTDPTTGNDTLAIQDAAGNDAASFTTGMNSVPAVINNSTLAAVAPFAPTGLTATASGIDTINLSWTAPVNNGGRIITGYKIEVSDDSGTTWTDLVADTASTTTTYEHTGLAANTTRHYRVSAINSIGTGTTPSDVVDATTGAPKSFSEKGPELVVPPPGTEGWLRVKWGERAGATGVYAYNVEWRTVVREDEAYRFQRVDKSAREHHLYNLESGTEYEVRVCELSQIEVCSRYSRIQMPSRGSAPSSNDIKVSIEFPEGGPTKKLSTSDTVIRWRYRVTGIHNSSPDVFQSYAHGVAAGRVALQYRDETRQVTVYGTASFGAPAPLTQGLDDLGIRMDWLVFDRVGSGYVEREFRVNPSFRTTTNRGPLMLYLLEDGDRRYPEPIGGRLSPHGQTNELCVEFKDAQDNVAVPCSSSQVEIDPPAVDGTPGVSGAGTDAQWSEGETVGVTVTFNEAVDVDTSGGTPSIGIGLGGAAARSATYASGSGTTELVFEYTLVSGDGSHGFMAITPDSLALNGGTIDSAGSGVAALLAHNGALTSGNTGNTQRSTAPAVTFADVPADHDGETAFTVNVQFSGAPTGLSAKRDAVSILEVTEAA